MSQTITTAAESPAGQPQGTHPSINLPLSFQIFCAKSRFTYYEFYIGHAKNAPLHAISGGYKLWFKTTLALHAGPDTGSPVLGSALIKGSNIQINLPSSSETITTKAKSSFKSLSCELAFDLPIEGVPAPEHFEWRRSRGPEVESLHGRGKGGWVLMRVDHGAELGEVVAAYSVDLAGMKHSGDFAFLNGGRTAKLGADFAVMAVVTALALGQRKREDLTAVVAATA
jgi:hypothetical protein